MDSLTFRIASRYLQASSLAHELQSKMDALLRENPLSPIESKGIAEWLDKNFHINSPKTPKGQKALKDAAQALLWWLTHGVTMSQNPKETVQHKWDQIQPHLQDLARYFSSEGGTTIPKQLEMGSVTFINGAGLDEKKLTAYANRLMAVFGDLKGWRRGAIDGGLKVRLASPKDFGGGTAGGKYRTGEDTLYVRATPNVLKREGTAYAGLEYILVHELGHRYEHRHHVPVDFDRPEWHTTPYSKKEGESFAELFALTNFGITSAHTTWGSDLNDRFNNLMGG